MKSNGLGYDNWNRVLKSEDPFQNEAEKSYNSTTGWPDYSKSYNNSTLTSFDAYQYDDLGRVLKVQKALFDPADNISNAGATSIGGIVSNEMTLEKLVTYDPDTGSVLTVEDSFGRRTEKYYDYLNRLIMVESYDANDLLVSVGRTAYDGTGRIAATQSWSEAKTIVTEYGYDYMGRVLSTCSKTTDVGATFNCIAPASSCTFTDEKCSYKWYNTGGQVIWSADTETGEYSATNPSFNVATVYAPVGNETTYRYNAFGDVTHTVRRMTDDGDGGGLRELSSNPYNSDGWIVTTYDYDSVGRLLKRSDDRGAETRYTYSADNLLLEEMYCPDSSCSESRAVNYTYNSKFDLMKEEYTQNSVTLAVNYFRDDFGRIKKKYTGETVDDVYQIFDYNERNLLMTAKSVDPTSTTSVLSEVTRTYDSLGMIRSESFDSASDGSSTISSEIDWDPSTRVLSETIALPSGKNIVETNINGLTDNLKYNNVTLLKYNYGAGNVLSSIYKNFDGTNHKIELNYSYTDWRKTDTRTEKFITPDPDEIIADYEYTYSKGLHLIGKQENEEDRREAYQYDSYYRLRRVDYDCDFNSNDPTCVEGRTNRFKCNSAEADCDDFQLDGVHNIRASYEKQTDYAWTVDGFNRLTIKTWGSNQIDYSYDSSNNMVGEDHDGDDTDDVVYTYDKLNRLITFSNDAAAVSYSYDPFNRRTKKTVTYVEGSDTFERIHKYLYDGWNIVSEEIKTVCTSDNPDTVTEWKLNRYIDHGMDNHVMMETVDCDDDNGNCDPDETTVSKIWFHKDERGNVIAISDGDDTILERYKYNVYGEHKVLNSDFTTKSTPAISPFLWGGSLYEPETNLYWMRNRYYHIDVHRFINQDPIGIWGDANNLGNGFAYVAGMVIEASDPTGLDIGDDIQKEHDPANSVYNQSVQTFQNEFYFNAFRAMDAAAREAFRDFAGLTFYSKLKEAINKMDAKSALEAAEAITNFLKKPGFAQALQNGLKGSLEGLARIENVGDLVKITYANGDVRYVDSKGNVYKKEGDQWYIRTSEGGWFKDEKWEKCDKPAGSTMPSDPDSGNDAIQNYLMNNALKEMLKLKTDEKGKNPLEEIGPVIKHDDNGRKTFIFNPYYRGKDPMEEVLWRIKTDSGMWGFIRNPFAPGAEYGYDSTTYEKFQQKGFIQPEVDPYWK